MDDLTTRILRVSEASFQRSGCTKFPDVRTVAKRAHCRMADIAEREGEYFCLDGVNVEGWKLGDLEVYVFNPSPPDSAA